MRLNKKGKLEAKQQQALHALTPKKTNCSNITSTESLFLEFKFLKKRGA